MNSEAFFLFLLRKHFISAKFQQNQSRSPSLAFIFDRPTDTDKRPTDTENRRGLA